MAFDKIYKEVWTRKNMQKGTNKRGQEGVTLTTLILIVIGVIVAIVIIAGATGFFDRIFGASEALPRQLEAVTQSCILAARSNLITDYCYSFKEIGNDEYVNCEDARVQDALTQQGIEHSITCQSSLKGNEINRICGELSPTQKPDAVFNSQSGLCS